MGFYKPNNLTETSNQNDISELISLSKTNVEEHKKELINYLDKKILLIEKCLGKLKKCKGYINYQSESSSSVTEKNINDDENSSSKDNSDSHNYKQKYFIPISPDKSTSYNIPYSPVSSLSSSDLADSPESPDSADSPDSPDSPDSQDSPNELNESSESDYYISSSLDSSEPVSKSKTYSKSLYRENNNFDNKSKTDNLSNYLIDRSDLHKSKNTLEKSQDTHFKKQLDKPRDKKLKMSINNSINIVIYY
jgi:hypothetical protein